MRQDFLGIYTPGTSVFHRMNVGVTYLVTLLIAVPPLFVQRAPVTLVFLVSAAACLSVARVGFGVLVLPWGMLAMLAFLGAYQGVVGAWDAAIVVVGNIVVALYASRLLMATTPGSVLLDALASFLGPLRRIGIDPERIALACGLMLRSIPYIVGCVGDVRDALRARGGRHNPALFLTPVVIRGVRFAQVTGEALAARGLGESSAADGR
ncbi:energy-coupling factor transporter transmembrane component T family protein [Propionicicella superfundia]|uniref:energy-coupling factor transporter transmembrane component T family protein n=1 Tax=Propionicicella superfundia TaxID=348582 RepID=UPI0004016D58|nr:energy-coupling factor transporter transmembrane component T [Propionicicella superfundia]